MVNGILILLLLTNSAYACENTYEEENEDVVQMEREDQSAQYIENIRAEVETFQKRKDLD